MPARTERRRPDPELLLKQVQAEERLALRGRLKVFLGYASGVGKTYTMLDEARRRRMRGEDVVVAAVQPKMPADADRILGQLEVIPMREVAGASVIDMETVLRRRPQVCVVDGLAYDNPPGSRKAYRWQDVDELLANGISVITSVNVQYIEERREQVERITAKHVTQTVPLAFVQGADEISIVDAPIDECIEMSGQPATGTQGTREQRLLALREIALLLAADVVDQQLEAYLDAHGIAAQWGTQERILVCITPRSDASQMIASGSRNATRFHGELYVVYVRQANLSPEDRKSLESNLQLAQKAEAKIHVIEGEDPSQTILKFAREHGITQIFIGHSGRRDWRARLFADPVDRLIRGAEGIDVQVFPH